MVGRVHRMQILLDRNKPVPLSRQIQAHLERLMREGFQRPDGDHIGRLKARTRNTAICPRVTVASGQYVVAPHPAVIRSRANCSIHLANG